VSHSSELKQLHAELEVLRPGLYRFALMQLRNATQAEDATQEAMLAVLEKPSNFAGLSTLRTYVTGILKFKIIDMLRASKRENSISAILPGMNNADDDASESDLIDQLFTANGHTVENARNWGNPEQTLEQSDFFRVLEVCIEKLPEKTAQVFMMREWLELDSEEICKELELSSSNLWVLLYRARLRLRECLDLNWFAERT